MSEPEIGAAPSFVASAGRVEAFADGVFGFAFTLLILDFHAPESTANLFPYLLSLWPRLLAYGISCLLIGVVWANHRAMFLHITKVDWMTLFLNVLLMADVAFLPFPTSLLATAISSGQGLSEAAFFYGAVLTIGGVFFNGLWLYEARRIETQRGAGTGLAFTSLRFALGPLAYLVATLCSLWQPVLAIGLYIALIIYFWLPWRAERRLGAAGSA